MLALAGIRKSKKQLLSQLTIIFIAALLLNLGLLVAINFNNYFDEKAEELNSAHVAVAFSNEIYDESYIRFFQNYDDVIATQKDDVLLTAVKLKMPIMNLDALVIAMNYDNMGDISKIKLIGETLPTNSRSIYVPYFLKFMGGLKLGDTFIVSINDNKYDISHEVDYEFEIAGFTEDIMLGVIDTGAIGLYLPEQSYKIFSDQLPESYKGVLLSSQLAKKENSTALSDEFLNVVLDGEQTSTWNGDIYTSKFARTATSNVSASVIVGFSIIILLVNLIVIRFRISNTIEEETKNYGALKAIGYTSPQIIASIVLQFTLTTSIVSVLGIAVSYIAVVSMSYMLAIQTGLNWVQGFDLTISTVSLLLVVFATALTAFLATLKIINLPPIVALRGGITTHSFRVNFFPLDKTVLPLTVSMALKTMVVNIKQNILIMLILASVSFAVIFSIVLSYNAPRSTFVDMLAGQYADISAKTSEKEDANEILIAIQNKEGVIEAVVCDFKIVNYSGQFWVATVMNDFANILNNQTYEGRNPKHANEVVISGSLAKLEKKEIGDTIVLSLGSREETYIITGFFQGSHNMGRESLLTASGYRQLNPNYKESGVLVNLSEQTDAQAFTDELAEKYGEKLIDIRNDRLFLENQLVGILGLINGFSVVVNIVTVLLVILILYLVVRTLIIRRKQELGVQKALGFTTFQLVNQISGSFIPISIVGIAIGSVFGALTMNTWMGLLFGGLGIMKVSFIIPLPIITVVSILLCILTYGVSTIVALQIKKISAYALMSE